MNTASIIIVAYLVATLLTALRCLLAEARAGRKYHPMVIPVAAILWPVTWFIVLFLTKPKD